MSNELFFIFCCVLSFSVDAKPHNENSLKRLQTRQNVRPMTFDYQGQKYDFDLVPSNRNVFSVHAPIWLVKSRPELTPNYTYELVEGKEEHLRHGHFFVDNDKKAVFFAHQDEETRQVLYEGVFGENKYQYTLEPQRGIQRRESKSVPVVAEPNYGVNGQGQKFEFLEREADPYHQYHPLKLKLKEPLDTFHVKLLVVVDHHLFRTLGSDIANTTKYIATFWNKVDQMYTELESPRVKISVNGIIIGNDKLALNYVYQNRWINKDPNDKREMASVDSLLEGVRMYFHYNFTSDVDFQNYDAVVLHTGYETGVIAGASHAGKICGAWYNVAVFKDFGFYNTIEVAIHELGHMLNMEHDTKEECAYTKDGKGRSIMTPSVRDTEYLVWSECSKESIREFATLQASECLGLSTRTRVYNEKEWW